MNPWTLTALTAIFSMEREIKVIFTTFFIICLLPVVAVLLVSQVGLTIVSGALVSRDPQSVKVEIRDPATGQVIDYIDEQGIWPVSGPVSLEFGKFHLPYQPFHTGIDIATYDHKVGKPVAAFMKGKVTEVKTLSWGYGKHVKIDHGHHVSTVYAHLDSYIVEVDQEVEVGEILGTLGDTGWSTGPHLHFEIRVFGVPINPRVFLGDELK